MNANSMSTAMFSDDEEVGSNALSDCECEESIVADDCERSAIISSSCNEDLLETDRDDATMAESIIRTRSSVYRTDGDVTASQTSTTDPMSSSKNEETSRIDSLSHSRGTSQSNSRGGNSLSGYTARVSDDTSADWSSPFAEESKMANHPSENTETNTASENQITLRWSATVDALPTLPKYALQAHPTEVLPSPLVRTTTVSTISTGPSDRSGDMSATQNDESVIHIPERGTAPVVAVPVPIVREPVHAVTVSIVNKAALSSAKRRKTILFACLIAAIVIAVSAVTAGVCGSLGCNGNEGNDDVPPSPSRAKLDDRTLALYSYINNITFGKILSPYENDTSPEAQALNWLVDSDPLQLMPGNSSFHIRQRYALLSFWFSSSNTDKWANSTGWLDYDDECEWFGISCTDIDHGPDTGLQLTVTSMDLGINGIVGVIPSDLGLLSNLQYFKLESNQLYGSIPSSIGQWTDLLHLEIQLNGQLSGRIPESIGNLHKLVSADFSYNLFSGELPSSIGNWKDLVRIDFSGLSLNSTIPSSVGNWKNVEFVSIMTVGGQIHGTLPESIGNWVNLRKLYLIDNDFDGTLPPSISLWMNLHVIDLSFNGFSGTIPGGVLNWTSIEEIYLLETELTGGLPEGMCSLSNLTIVQADCSSKNFTCICCTFCN